MANAVVIDACRTPRGEARRALQGTLSGVHPQELIATCLRALVDRNPGFDPADVEDVYMGAVQMRRAVNVDGQLKYGGGEQDQCVARLSVLAADWPEHIPGVMLNRFCGSGLQAITFGHAMVVADQQSVVVGGGVESMSRNPMYLPTDDDPDLTGLLTAYNPDLFQKHPLVPQGISADLIATREGFSRKDVDQFALESQQKAKVAADEARFDRGIVPVKDANGTVILDHDEHPRPDSTLEVLGNLKPAFAPLGPMYDKYALERYPEVKEINHVHTAGNSSGIVDGAAVALVMSEQKAKEAGLKPRCRILATASVGDEPVIMLTGPVRASKNVLKKAGMTVGDIDLFEINEAFATVPLLVIRELGIDRTKVNVNGGAIALGHPLGGTGAVLFGTALDELERQDLSRALITLCTGGGMAVAAIIERT